MRHHLEAAEQTALRRDRLGGIFAHSVHIERVWTHIDAVEVALLSYAPDDYVYAQIPNVLAHTQAHLDSSDPRRRRLEELAEAPNDSPRQARLLSTNGNGKPGRDRRLARSARGILASALEASHAAERTEVMRVRAFRNILMFVSGIMLVIAVALGVLAYLNYTKVDVCFNPVETNGGKIVCPINETAYEDPQGTRDLDNLTSKTASPGDIPIILIVGAAAAALASAISLRQIQSGTTPYSLPVALAALKIPTGALTALLGLLLMRGQFIPGLSALDFPAQIIAWALIFGYAQQLLTRMVDQRAQSVLKAVVS